MTLLDGENYWEIFPNPIVMDKDDLVEALADWIERIQYRREHRHENELYKRRARLAARRRRG